MPYLLDTHTFLWLASDDPHLTPTARAIWRSRVETGHHEQACLTSRHDADVG